jgi:hypothetical protein
VISSQPARRKAGVMNLVQISRSERVVLSIKLVEPIPGQGKSMTISNLKIANYAADAIHCGAWLNLGHSGDRGNSVFAHLGTLLQAGRPSLIPRRRP